ncbi:methyltransferase domain-containing protein (plasmid) [Nitrobacter sp. NHB1]|uniref:methyltransferase domain-containing protein n=1 Tax=Nitrobacter sp. NHB1 TaxID=3119830 RepID=UPI002FFF4C45
MKILGRFKGKLGDIAIWESERTGDRLYREGEIFQSESSATGESRLPYVKMMEVFLGDAKNVLLLGCGGGNLATMLVRSGKNVTVVDHSPISFDLAKRFFGMPKEISCFVADFREYLAAETRSFDGIAVDVGGPGFCYEEQFDPATCHSITARLSRGGRTILNMLVATDFDAAPDLIASDLSEDHLSSWIFDQPGLLNRNVLLACLPKGRRTANKHYMAEFSRTTDELWTLRRPRRPSHHSQTVVVEIA